MNIIEAVYQKGILKPLQHLNLPDNTRVRVQVIPSEEMLAENRFKQHLVELGLLNEVRVPHKIIEEDRIPIKVKGKPLSQAIIEERC
ncbi:MAG: antitoxin family protein [Chloroflexota bacterium]|nr:antitoxin family protein [Chloroflexota bacterium]